MAVQSLFRFVHFFKLLPADIGYGQGGIAGEGLLRVVHSILSFRKLFSHHFQYMAQKKKCDKLKGTASVDAMPFIYF